MKLLMGLMINLQFFTSIPIKRELPMDQQNLRGAVQAFPLVGFIQGVSYSILLYAVMNWTPFSHVAAAFLLWLATILLTGGIHLDGWMDASDAYFSYQDQEKRLEIMKDPRTGAFGVISVIVLLSCRFFFIYELTMNIGPVIYYLIAALPFFSKSVMGAVLLSVQSAKNEGLGRMFQQAATVKVLWIYPCYILVFLIAVFWSREFFIPMCLLLLASILCYLIFRRNALKWFGGITGDVLGATVEGTELILWMTVWLLHYFVMA
ncbi:adenosylcobinamide-GDP ribazoletransferase [Neobacillus drentensis]|uniref:adenosylcobinamide-GDP ribazoletransferase n=1 Tax=Neobacillus drentensis TaxID=220684 RepID=UPI001F1C4F7F|nr:adenosylcobinamide-GDP ribazoletransferase [Neobacillus drentensis]ULT58786.1 adenosylcobinamide-GDP ribazoletransferase [Neobacillus drentensis]